MWGHPPIFWVAQTLAAVGLIVMFWSSYSISRKVTIVGRGLSSLFFAFEYVLLGMWSSAGVAAVNTVRGFAMAKEMSLSARRWTMAVFLFAQTLLFVCVTGSFATPVALLPLLGSALSTIAFAFERVSRIKVFTILSSASWVTFFVISGLWVNFLGDAIGLVVAALAFRRAVKSESAVHDGAAAAATR